MIINLNQEQLWKTSPVNLIPSSIDENGNIVGLIKDYRYNSSDTLVSSAGKACCGFIPVKYGDVIHFENIPFGATNNGAVYLRAYTTSMTPHGSGITPHELYVNNYPSSISFSYGNATGSITAYLTYKDNKNIDTVRIDSLTSQYELAYIRMAWDGYTGNEIIWKE